METKTLQFKQSKTCFLVLMSQSFLSHFLDTKLCCSNILLQAYNTNMRCLSWLDYKLMLFNEILLKVALKHQKLKSIIII